MASIERTAYPRFGKRMSIEELRARYELTGQERRFVEANANGARQRLTLAVLLKARQQLGYFPSPKEVPGQIVKHLAGQFGFSARIHRLSKANLRTSLHRYRAAVRNFLGSKAYGAEDRQRVEQVILKATETMSDPADLINAAVEELIKTGIELPAYSTLDRLAGNLRQQVHETMYARMTQGLNEEQRIKLDALTFVREYRHARRETLPYEINLGFAGRRWQAFVETGKDGETVLDRRALEVCVFIHLAEALSRLDFYVEGSEEYPDYRRQLLSRGECRKRLPEYCEAVGLPTDGKAFAASLKQELAGLSREVDAGFPENAELTIGKDGRPHLKKQSKTPLPEGLRAFESEVRARMPQRHLLDILRNAQHWTGFTRHFGPPSGSDPKLPEADKQYVIGTFGYGCNLGASQTASHIREGVNRNTMRRMNAQHVTSEKLDAARNDVVADFVRFEVTRYWGDGKAMIADGTLVELRENNLLGSRHVRYDKYGKIAYHHISNRYIALFCNFIACGVWEGVYILDAFINDFPDELKPDTLHADTHGQSETIFGLAALLDIKLLPRMRTWNDVVFYRPDRETRYEHIDALFSEVIDWKLIETHYHDMMRVALSIQAGRVPPSMLLKRLGVRNRKNTLYRAFRELGRVQRTLFLLRYISRPKLRRTIRAETTKIESFNDFLDWITFGGPVIKSGDPVEQTKRVKYTSLVANAIMLQNVVDLTDAINGMIAEGYPVTPEFISRLSPYMRRYILRFGRYVLNEDIPEPLQPMPIQLTA